MNKEDIFKFELEVKNHSFLIDALVKSIFSYCEIQHKKIYLFKIISISAIIQLDAYFSKPPVNILIPSAWSVICTSSHKKGHSANIRESFACTLIPKISSFDLTTTK